MQRPPVRYHGPTPEELRLDAAGRTEVRRFSTLGPALLTSALATLVPGAGHLALRRFRTGAAIMAAFVLGLLTLLVLTLRADRSDLLGTLLSSRTLVGGAIGLLVAALAWMAVIVRTYLLARPTGLRTGQRVLGAGVVAVLCLTVAAPLGFGAELANSQRQLLERLFPALSGGTPGRRGDRQGTVERAAGRQRRGTGPARHPDGHDDGRERRHPDGPHDPLRAAPQPPAGAVPGGLADGPRVPPGLPRHRRTRCPATTCSTPCTPTRTATPRSRRADPPTDPGLNLLHSTVETMLGLKLDYYVEVNMAGFAAIIDALGGLTVDVGPEPLPVGGITPTGRHVKPDRYIPAGPQHLDGTDTLAVARSRTNSDDYTRMGRQRCLLQYVLQQKSPADLLTNFQGVAAATTDSVSTNIPQQVLPALVKVADSAGTVALESVSFDPNLADPSERDGRFDTSRPDPAFMQRVVRDTIAGPDGRGPSARPARRRPPPGRRRRPASRATADDEAPRVGAPGADEGRHVPRPVVLSRCIRGLCDTPDRGLSARRRTNLSGSARKMTCGDAHPGRSQEGRRIMALPTLTPEQRQEALKKAAAARTARKELRDAIARGDETIPAVLGRAKTDAVVGKTKVADLLKSLPGYGPAKVSALLEQTGIDASRRAAGLGDRQKQALLDALS